MAINMKVPFINLKIRYETYKNEISKSLEEIGQNTDYILGKSVNTFQIEMAEYIGCKYVIGVNSGFDALFLSLIALNISLDDEIITVSNSYIATANSIKAVGAKPIFVDVKEDYNIAIDQIENKISKKTKAIMPVHLTGNPCEMDKIMKIARKYNLHVIEDAAQAIGSKFKDKKVGTWGDLSCFSMHPIKNLGLLGDGGFICTNSQPLQEKLLLLRNHGHKNRDEVIDFGYNSRLDTFQASIALIFLKEIDKWNNRKNEIANMYRSSILKPIIHPFINKKSFAVYQNYIVLAPKREDLMKYLLINGIETKVHYPIPIHKQEAYKDNYKNQKDLIETERQIPNILSLPIYPELTNSQVKLTIDKINEFYKEKL